MSSLILLLAVVCVLIGVAGVERGPNRSKELALIAALAAAAAGGRVLFAFVPNVQPVTIIVAVTGATLARAPGSPSAARRRSCPTRSSARARGRPGR